MTCVSVSQLFDSIFYRDVRWTECILLFSFFYILLAHIQVSLCSSLKTSTSVRLRITYMPIQMINYVSILLAMSKAISVFAISTAHQWQVTHTDNIGKFLCYRLLCKCEINWMKKRSVYFEISEIWRSLEQLSNRSHLNFSFNCTRFDSGRIVLFCGSCKNKWSLLLQMKKLTILVNHRS